MNKVRAQILPAKVKKRLKVTIEFSLKLQKCSATAQNTRNNQLNYSY